MRMLLMMMLVIVPVVFVLFAALAAGQPVKGEAAVVLQVQDKSGMFDTTPLGTLYMASNANNWDPKGSWSFAHEAPTSTIPGGWLVAIPRRVVEETVRARGKFEFKFTRGSWETVEVGLDGQDIGNRVLDAVDFAGWERGEGSPTETLELEGFADQRGARWSTAARPSTVTGTLEVFDFSSAIRGSTRKLRVWTPPGYGDAANAGTRYPVLYMHDGQNCFDDATAFAGEWQVDETMTMLIAAGKVPATIVVGIDNAGSERGNEYVPIKIGPRMPGAGGKAHQYMDMLVTEILPLIDAKYRTIADAEHRSLGGSSFGGIITLQTAMSKPGVFGAILVESPSLWIGEQTGMYIGTIRESRAPWPRRVFMAMGGKEYGDAERDGPLQTLFKQAEAALREKGLDETRLRAVIDPEGRHNEQTWARRLPGALEFLLGK
jgi:predicted alpha/beta superfamily hydrolase